MKVSMTKKALTFAVFCGALSACGANDQNQVTPVTHRYANSQCRTTSIVQGDLTAGMSSSLSTSDADSTAASALSTVVMREDGSVAPADPCAPKAPTAQPTNAAATTSAATKQGAPITAGKKIAAKKDVETPLAFETKIKTCAVAPTTPPDAFKPVKLVDVIRLKRKGTYVLTSIIFDIDGVNTTTKQHGRIYGELLGTVLSPAEQAAATTITNACGGVPKNSGLKFDNTIVFPNAISAVNGRISTTRLETIVGTDDDASSITRKVAVKTLKQGQPEHSTLGSDAKLFSNVSAATQASDPAQLIMVITVTNIKGIYTFEGHATGIYQLTP
jgi:hypothetical protein